MSGNGKRNGRAKALPSSDLSRVPTVPSGHAAGVGAHRLLGYVRVSTAEQAEEGVSLETQEHRIGAYAQAHGFAVVAVEVERGASGKSLARTALQSALKRLRNGEADGLAVMRLDRLSRSTTDVLGLMARSEREGWTLHSITESLDTSTPHGRFVVTILAGLAQMEREQIGERTRNALAELRRQGKRISGKPPLGYRFECGMLVEVETEQRALKTLTALRAEGCGARSIARRMNGDGIVNPRTGLDWSCSTVASILRRIGQRS